MATKHVSLRLDLETHSLINAAADLNHRSLNGEIEWAIDQHLLSMGLRRKKVRHRDGDLEVRGSER
jgi:hypothetical protein